MALKNILKKVFLQSADLLPDSFGFALYHALQKSFTDSTAAKIRANEKTFLQFSNILSKFSSIRHKEMLEIGSGWMPIMPYLLKLNGVCDVVNTYDINDHYQNKYIDELNALFQKEKKFDFEISKTGLHLPDFVKYHPNSNVIHAELPKNVDLIFSRFVLEHVTPKDIKEMHDRFYRDFDDQTMILHFISPSDHRAYSDKSISHYDFLKYSQQEWNKIQTKFDYHNRLRLPQYLDIFKSSGFEVLYLDYDKVDPNSEKYKMFKELTMHQDFASYSEEELLAGSINVLLKKKAT